MRIPMALWFVAALAANTGELRFGELRLSDLPGQDVMILPKCEKSWNEPVKRLVLEVRGTRAYLHDLELRDDADRTQTLVIRSTLEPQRPPRFVDLVEPMCVRRIEVMPDPAAPPRPYGGETVLVVHGEVAPPEGEVAPPPG